jgi:hypothetical protein
MTAIVQLEHPVRDFDGWKRAFDSDPLGRQAGGVRRYRISRPPDDPNYVVVDLEFDNVLEAEAFLDRLRALWSRVVEEGLIDNPRARILDEAESAEI